MASLIEELIDTLDLENNEYTELLELSKQKTPIIINGEIEALNNITAKEQEHTDNLAALENKRTQVVEDIATVLNMDVKTITVKKIIDLLNGQEKEQNALAEVHDKLKMTLNDMAVINDMNKQLLQESLELVDFDINFINSLNQYPETANYTKNAYNASTYANSTFDAKN